MKKKQLKKIIIIAFIVYVLGMAIIASRKETEQYLYTKNYSNRPNAKIVTYLFCYDGDTVAFEDNDGMFIKCRFLNVDSPEYDEFYGKEAKEYTDAVLRSSKIIEIEYDPNSRFYDEYGRHLVYVFVDSELLNEKLVKEGFAYNRYGRTDYLFFDVIRKAEEYAKDLKLGIWS